MRQGRQQIGTQRAHRTGKIALEGGKEALETGFLFFQEDIHRPTLAGEEPFDLFFGVLIIVASAEDLVVETQLIHRVEPHEFEVIGRIHARFDEDPVEERLHHEEGRSDVESVAHILVTAGAAAETILLLEEVDLDATAREQEGAGHSARPPSDDDHFFGGITRPCRTQILHFSSGWPAASLL